jgi:MFS transporter, DHA2 family, multidrug resistance protein
MVGIAPGEAGAALGFFNTMRTRGGATGAAANESFFPEREQFRRLAWVAAAWVPRPRRALHRAVIAVGDIVGAQATIMGYADCFALLTGRRKFVNSGSARA